MGLKKAYDDELTSHELSMENRRQNPQPQQTYPTPYEIASQYRTKDTVINTLRAEGSFKNQPAESERGPPPISADETSQRKAANRKHLREELVEIKPSLGTKLEIFLKELPVWIPKARSKPLSRNWTCTVRRGLPPFACDSPGNRTGVNMASCTYNKNDRGGCEPGELDLFRYGMVNYMMTYGNLLDFLEDA